jgi:hypothetical protein
VPFYNVFKVYTSATAWSYQQLLINFNVAGTIPQNIYFPYSDFVQGGSSPVDWTNVGAIMLLFEHYGYQFPSTIPNAQFTLDAHIGAISTGVTFTFVQSCAQLTDINGDSIITTGDKITYTLNVEAVALANQFCQTLTYTGVLPSDLTLVSGSIVGSPASQSGSATLISNGFTLEFEICSSPDNTSTTATNSTFQISFNALVNSVNPAGTTYFQLTNSTCKF